MKNTYQVAELYKTNGFIFDLLIWSSYRKRMLNCSCSKLYEHALRIEFPAGKSYKCKHTNQHIQLVAWNSVIWQLFFFEELAMENWYLMFKILLRLAKYWVYFARFLENERTHTETSFHWNRIGNENLSDFYEWYFIMLEF